MPGDEADAALDSSRERDAGLAAQADAQLADAQLADAQLADARGPGAADASGQADAHVDAGVRTVVLSIVEDADDAVWIAGANDGLVESLHFDDQAETVGYVIEVGTDSEACRTGLRFPLPIERGAQIQSATLRLQRIGSAGTASPSASMRVQVFESLELAPFDSVHRHQSPSQHAPSGLWNAGSVGNYRTGIVDTYTVSPDLSVLLQHAIDQPGWLPGGHVGLLLSADEMQANSYAQFRDSFHSASGPELTVTYVP